MTDVITQRIPEVQPPRPRVAPLGNTLIVRMREQADLSQERQLPRGPERRAAVWNDLVATGNRTQGPALDQLAQLSKQGLVEGFEQLYVPNAIVVRAAAGKHAAVADALRGVAAVQGVTENKAFAVETQPADSMAPAHDAARGAAAIEWGVDKINAPAAWKRGYDGTGITVGVIDTGLDATHPAISAHYRGTAPDGSQSHDYNWLDPIKGRPTAYDDGDHGTHVGGSVAGGTPDRAIGVAPGAKLIAAKAINGSGYNTTEATLKALQFMLAPTDTKGRNPRPELGADVVNNSWGNADLADETFRESFDVLAAAGIEMVSAAGNDGPRGKISPPASYPGHISVAATTSGDSVASFSSRGPSRFSPDNLLPNVAAPGQSITSSVPGGRYASFSGTSMASPHAAGAVAILLQAKPDATHEQIVEALAATAVDIDAKGPDVNAGYGRIDVAKALDHLLGSGRGRSARPHAGR